MRLSWIEVRVRAASFAKEWRDAAHEKGETQSFYNDLFEVFDVRRRSVARYEEHVTKLDNGRGYIDLYRPGVLIVEQKGAGRDLGKACGQAGEYFDALRESDRPRYIMVSDFQTFELHELDERRVVTSRPRIVRRSDRPAGLNADQGTPKPAECPVVPSTPIFPELPC